MTFRIMRPMWRFRAGQKSLAALVLLAAGLPTLAHAAPRQCWAPKQLSYRPGEERITKGIRAAFLPVPHGKPRRPDRNFHLVRGSIRRIALPPGKKLVALTFDLCEQPYEITGYQGDIVDYLREHGVAATFFAGGKWMLTHTERAEQLMSDPLFQLANHSWEHRNFRLLAGKRLVNEIEGAQLAYERVHADLSRRSCLARATTRPAHDQAPPRLSLFRFPFGACNAQALRAVNDRGLLAIQWDVSAADPWKGQTVEKMTSYVLSRARSGSIIIFHANGRGWKTRSALPAIIAGLRSRGFGFATIKQMLAIPGAKPVATPTCYDVRPGDSDRYDDLGRRLEIKYQQFYTAVGARSPRQ